MTNLEIFLILALVCFICGGSQGLRSRSKAVQLKQKIRRCSDTVTIHRRDENSNEKQSGSSESKETQKSDENNLKADKASADGTPIPEDIKCTNSGTDEICWDFEKEQCFDLVYSRTFHKGIQCESDEDCKESDPCQSGKCCEIPCEHLSEYYHVVDKMCRYPIDNQNLLNSFSPERNRTL
ncbi:uncharacterized protein LOC133193317 isoform X1 [Saccostrea echinata]|uniref:uncharacterized protein LOC133193317 isoform X1 n=1 Tax=Saccostrea echinata TaxID=191078 RepID=UPI002A807B02|nr:uncharacterized protein LOC133193317 isoform X1 [Saccostrea echinata]